MRVIWVIICTIMLFLTIQSAIATDTFCGNSSQTLFVVVQYSNGTLATNASVIYQLWNNSLINAPNMGGGYYNISLVIPVYMYGGINYYFYNVSSINPSANSIDQLYVTNCTTSLINRTIIFSITPASPIYYGNQTNASCNGDLFRDSVNATSENNIYIILPIGTHNYSCQLQGNSTHLYVEHNESYNVLTVPSTSNGGGQMVIEPIPNNCSYSLNKQVYYLNDTVTITFSCPKYLYQSFIANWNNKEGVMYYTEEETITNSNTISYIPISPMKGITTVKVGNQLLFTQEFEVKSEFERNIGYFYMFLLGLAILIIIYYLNLFLKYEQSKDLNKRLLPNIKSEVITILSLLGIIIGVGFYLFNSNKVGYAYMVLIGITIFIFLFILNRLLARQRKNR